jgi:hypothetical protein
MDDRDLEARLSTHLHRRFDDAQPSPDLVRGVEQVVATRPRQLDLSVRRVRGRMRLGYSLTAAAAAIVVLAIAATNLGIHLGPNAGAGPSPSPSSPIERTFIVLPASPEVPSKAESTVAGNVLMARLRALGVGTFTMGGGYGMTFILPASGPADDLIRAVLAAPGSVRFIPIPSGDPTVVAGQTLPPTGAELFGSEGVASIKDGTDQNGNPALDVELTPAGERTFADWTPQHVGEQLAIVLDGRVVSAPIILAPIRGTIQISNESSSAGVTLDAATRAILMGGILPHGWQGARVPVTIPEEAAVATALAQPGVAELVHAQLDAATVVGQWRAVWDVMVGGSFRDFPCTSGSPSPCPISGIEVVQIDAVNGGVMAFYAGAPTP